jgi:acetylornithine/succinyldiaminopimelate/putrescine aminotransferase
VTDVDGNRYLDMLSAYSALNFGYSNERLIAAASKQLSKVTLTSRAFHNDQLGPFCKELCELSGYEAVLPMNSGAEAVETAIKTARKWGYYVKGIAKDKAEIICAKGNFHGRTVTVVSFSTMHSIATASGRLRLVSRSWTMATRRLWKRQSTRTRRRFSSSRFRQRAAFSFRPKAI